MATSEIPGEREISEERMGASETVQLVHRVSFAYLVRNVETGEMLTIRAGNCIISYVDSLGRAVKQISLIALDIRGAVHLR